VPAYDLHFRMLDSIANDLVLSRQLSSNQSCNHRASLDHPVQHGTRHGMV